MVHPPKAKYTRVVGQPILFYYIYTTISVV